MDLYAQFGPEVEPGLLEELRHSVEKSHEMVLAEAEREHGHRGMATTLTMVMARWPRAYLVHVGDSRCYRLRAGKLELLTRDQTLAQALVDAGRAGPRAEGGVGAQARALERRRGERGEDRGLRRGPASGMT